MRSYQEIVRTPLAQLPASTHKIIQYGALSHDPNRYPLLAVAIGDIRNSKPNILITGGVHGYEQTGVLSALQWATERAPALTSRFNFVVVPCVSPWAMEMDHRWNRAALDTNRHFRRDSVQTEECAAFMDFVEGLGVAFAGAVDLHETNKRDIELAKERCARDGEEYVDEPIPPGFYLVVYQRNEALNVGPRIIEHVACVTAIEQQPDIFGMQNQGGVLRPKLKGTCAGYAVSLAPFAVTTEINPDNIPHDEAMRAQIASIEGALDCVPNA